MRKRRRPKRDGAFFKALEKGRRTQSSSPSPALIRRTSRPDSALTEPLKDPVSALLCSGSYA